MKNRTPLWREAHFQVNMPKTPQCRTTFGRRAVPKVHASGTKHMPKSKLTLSAFGRSDAEQVHASGTKHISKSKN